MQPKIKATQSPVATKMQSGLRHSAQETKRNLKNLVLVKQSKYSSTVIIFDGLMVGGRTISNEKATSTHMIFFGMNFSACNTHEDFRERRDLYVILIVTN